MLSAITYIGDSSSGLGALGFNAQAFIIQMITFILAFLILRRYAFKPIIKILRERTELIESGVKLGEEMRTKQIELESQVAEELHKARLQADAILAEAQDGAREISREAETKARKKAEIIINEAKQRTELDIARARKQLEHEVIGLVSEATEAIIDEKLDNNRDAALIEKAIKGYTGL